MLNSVDHLMSKPRRERIRKAGPGARRNPYLTALGLALACAAKPAGAASFTPVPGIDPAPQTNAAPVASPGPRFNVLAYVVKSDPTVFTNAPAPALAQYTGANVGLDRIVRAASELQGQYRERGYPRATVSIAQGRITNGIVTMHVYEGALGQVLISGKPSVCPPEPNLAAGGASKPSVPFFNVRAYEITGDTLLSTNTLMSIFVQRTGTNVTLEDIKAAAADLQLEYRDRGYPTVSVTIPQQQISNGIVKLKVFEGRLAEVTVTKNRYFSSNNVMRALPGLRTNMILNGVHFQQELDRANLNQDRQLYPRLEPGPVENTTALNLQVKDRFPAHGKVELNDQSTAGSPDLRVNTSAAYYNLWQHEHSLGLQYTFSPEAYKVGNWNFYDRPLVANYSAFYRLPLGHFDQIDEDSMRRRGHFGYDEASRKFNLPPPSGRPELNIYASRSATDTGLMTTYDAQLYNTNGNSLRRTDVQRDVTENGNLGFRLTLPLPPTEKRQSSVSFGPDYKVYKMTSDKTNTYVLKSIVIDNTTSPPQTNVNVSIIPSAVPTTVRELDYLPLSVRYDLTQTDSRGATTLGLGLSRNFYRSGSTANLHNITSSSESGGHWVTFTPSLSRDFTFHTNWTFMARADGQWANEPLISNEQYGLGGLATVRGYHEGEVFGDTGWHMTLEQKTPAYVLGMGYAKHPLTVRGSFYTDYGEAYLMDPQSRSQCTRLWGAGFGGVATLGPTWEARLLFSWPLLSAGSTQAGAPRFDFSLSAQF
jgi:hemolysin activation/secretion protein